MSKLNLTVLVIDDELVLRRVMTSFLEDENFNVITAENGKIGIEKFKEHKPDLILTDLQMPEVDGLEVLKTIKTLSPDTPLIVISGTGHISDTVEALHNGAWDYLLKPIEDYSILRHAIKQVLEKSKLIQDNHKYQTDLESLVELKTSELKKSNLELTKHKENLEQVIYERTKELKEAQSELIENAHQVGMSEISRTILHNIGNIINSVKVSAYIVKENIDNEAIKKFRLANKLLKKHINNIDDFILNNPKGKQLLNYYLSLEEVFDASIAESTKNIDRLDTNVEAITNVIIDQQNFVQTSSYAEELDIRDLINNALEMREQELIKNNITVTKNFFYLPKLFVHKTKVIHIIVNILKNAQESIVMANSKIRNIEIKTEVLDNEYAYIKIRDTGGGISPENLEKIFNFGFTTKSFGNGIGLHSCGNYMTEMGGTMIGINEEHGARFVLEFPFETCLKAK